ncbi:MAG: hypothetical protein AAGF15_03620 [Pseudomonadota bacterium]
MDIAWLKREIEAIKSKGAPQPVLIENDHRTLFEMYRDIAFELETEDGNAEGLESAQTALMQTSASRRAHTIHELLFKLALWRWDAPDLDIPMDQMTRYDAVAYSVFRDLAAMLCDTSVLTARDY